MGQRSITRSIQLSLQVPLIFSSMQLFVFSIHSNQYLLSSFENANFW